MVVKRLTLQYSITRLIVITVSREYNRMKQENGLKKQRKYDRAFSSLVIFQ